MRFDSFSRSPRKFFLFLLALAILGFGIFLNNFFPYAAKNLWIWNFKWYDLLHKNLPLRQPSEKILLLPVPSDRSSLIELQREPKWKKYWESSKGDFPRGLHGILIKKLKEDGASVIAFDIRFAEEKDPLQDKILVDAVKKAGNVILVEDVEFQSQKSQFQDEIKKRYRPFKALDDAAKDIGTPFLTLDQDGVVRSLKLYKDTTSLERPITAFSALIYLAMVQKENNDSMIRKDPKSGHLYLGPTRLSIAQSERFFIRFAWKWKGKMNPEIFTDYNKALEGTYPGGFFKGKAVIIYDAGDVHDRYPAPFIYGSAKTNRLPGGVIHAAALATLLSGKFIVYFKDLEYILMLIVAILSPLLFGKYNLFRALFYYLVLGFSIAGTSAVAYFKMEALIPIVMPLSYMLIYSTALTLIDFLAARNFFIQFAGKRKVDKILQDGTISMEIQKKVVTVLFSDLRGYTSLTEKEDATIVINQLREYINSVSIAVSQLKGEIIDYQGDGTVAMFLGESIYKNHAVEGALAALEILNNFQKLQEKWQKEGKQVMDLGIALSSGKVALGIVGGARHRQSGVVGDCINTSARLQSFSNVYDTGIIVGESTLENASGLLETSYLDEVQLKGKSQPVKIYRLIKVKEVKS